MRCVFHQRSPGDYVCTKCGASILYSGALPLRRICDVQSTELPGTELHALLGKFGLTASGDCKCNQRARYMDEMGCDWCEANIDEIVGWLRESAAERGLPFLDVAARLLVRRAIANARRKEAASATGSRLHAER